MNDTMNTMRTPMDALQAQPSASDDYGFAGDADDGAITRRSVRIGSSGLLFAEGDFGEVFDPAPSLHIVPNTTEWFSGVVNVRGNIVPVFDVALLLNHQSTNQKHLRLFVYGKGDAMAAFYVDNLPQKSLFNHQHLLPQSPLETSLDQYVQASYVLDDIIWLDMDMKAMFSGLSGRMKTK